VKAARKPRSLTRGERNCNWIEKYCRIPEGKFVGQPVRLRPWQRAIVTGIYDTPTRRAIISFGKKNAKTALSAMLLLLHLAGPEFRRNGQLYSGAQSREQASVLFGLASKIVELSVDLSAEVVIRDTVKELYCPSLGTKYKALSAEAKTKHGLSPVFMVHDELGQVRGPRFPLYDALETAAGANDEPLSIVISTQAPEDGDLLSILIDDAAKKTDPMVKLFLWTAPLGDELHPVDPFAESTIKQANPAYGDFLNAKEVLAQAEDARRMPSKENTYRNLVLNQRVQVRAPFVSRSVWDRCAGAPDPELLRTATLYMGLDLSARNDLTALITIAEDAAGVWHVFSKFYAPEKGVIERARRDRVPYDVWAKQGFITLTPGASVDYDFVARDLVELWRGATVGRIAFDRWRMDVLKKAVAGVMDCTVEEIPLPLADFGQGFKDMSPAIDDLEADFLNTRIRHGGNPVLTSCVANAVVTRDPAGNRKLDKSLVTQRIDGAVALAMARGAATAAKPDEDGPLFVEL
jgi:phage terminase large subunit-like protein